MKPSKTLTLAFFVASFAVGTAIAEPAVSPDDLSAQTATNDAKPRGGFGTNAKVALLYADGQIIHSVNVSSVTNPSTGVFCVTPSVKLNFKKIYPQVTNEHSRSIGAANWTYWLDTTNNPTFCTETQIEIVTLTLLGTTIQSSNQVAFDLIVQ